MAVYQWELYRVSRPEPVRNPKTLAKRLDWKPQILAGCVLCSQQQIWGPLDDRGERKLVEVRKENKRKVKECGKEETKGEDGDEMKEGNVLQEVKVVRWSKPVELNWGCGPTLPYFYSVLIENSDGRFLFPASLQPDQRRGLFEIIPPHDLTNDERSQALKRLELHSRTYTTKAFGTKPWEKLKLGECSVCLDRLATEYLHCDVSKLEADAHFAYCKVCCERLKKVCVECTKPREKRKWQADGLA